MDRYRFCLAWSLLLTAMLWGCASGPGSVTRETLDMTTGVTITTSRTPIVLYRDTPARAAYARQLLHLGPIEVNRSGDYRYFLWLGIWTTDQAPGLADERDGFESIVLLVDGEPLNLELAGWTPSAIGASAPVYVKPVASAADAYYAVTLDQIRFLAAAADLRLRTTGAAPSEYLTWDDPHKVSRGLASFLETVGY